ncbi:MAG: hypothetical protein AB1503_04065 [Bacillota bacterium]|nr:hypothetical protein [Bacillota bacterium]
MDVLEQVAEMVRQNPAITVAEIAQKLGYAESKSIYYWLHKARFRGFKEFKKAVLTGVFPERLRRPSPLPNRVRERRVPYSSDLLPLARGLGPDGGPVWAGVSSLPRRDLSERAFALDWLSGEYFPFFMAGDHLAVDPEAPLQSGDTVLGIAGELPVLLRYYGPEASPLFAHPVTGQPQDSSPPPTLVGRVMAVYRIL